MTNGNVRVRERFELALDGWQIATIVVTALVTVSAVFVLGLKMGQHLASRQPERPAIDLAGLDRVAVVDGAAASVALNYDTALRSKKPAPPPPLEPAAPSPAKAAAPAQPAPAPAPARAAPTPTLAQAAPAPATPAPAAAPTGEIVVPAPIHAAPPAATARVEDAPRPEAAPAHADAPAPAPTSHPRTDAAARAEAARVARPEAAVTHADVAVPHTAPPRPAVAAGKGFTVQLASAQSREDASRVVSKVKGHATRVVEADVPGKGHYFRVRVGRFDSREAAERFRDDLSRETGVKGVVMTE